MKDNNLIAICVTIVVLALIGTQIRESELRYDHVIMQDSVEVAKWNYKSDSIKLKQYIFLRTNKL